MQWQLAMLLGSDTNTACAMHGPHAAVANAKLLGLGCRRWSACQRARTRAHPRSRPSWPWTTSSRAVSLIPTMQCTKPSTSGML